MSEIIPQHIGSKLSIIDNEPEEMVVSSLTDETETQEEVLLKDEEPTLATPVKPTMQVSGKKKKTTTMIKKSIKKKSGAKKKLPVNPGAVSTAAVSTVEAPTVEAPVTLPPLDSTPAEVKETQTAENKLGEEAPKSMLDEMDKIPTAKKKISKPTPRKKRRNHFLKSIKRTRAKRSFRRRIR